MKRSKTNKIDLFYKRKKSCCFLAHCGVSEYCNWKTDKIFPWIELQKALISLNFQWKKAGPKDLIQTWRVDSSYSEISAIFKRILVQGLKLYGIWYLSIYLETISITPNSSLPSITPLCWTFKHDIEKNRRTLFVASVLGNCPLEEKTINSASIRFEGICTGSAFSFPKCFVPSMGAAEEP